jgi:mono/diheme cytochrome c family protein
VAVTVSFVPAWAGAQTVKKEAARPIQSVEGVDSYKEYCAQCHGPNGTGNGPAASALKVAPADLTTITKRKGSFSAADVETRIIGKNLPASHGGSDMPFWGHVFDAFGDPSVSKLRVNNLVAYIKSIQK